jgi:glycosyltransferase involved in cell wall biosynthesis
VNRAITSATLPARRRSRGLRDTLLAQAQRLGVSADVSLPGFEPNPFAEMRAARVFVLSSRFEGLPGVLVQAMACGAPVVSTDCPGGPREILEDGRWGRLVPVGDAGTLAGAIAAMLDAPQAPDVRTRAAEFSEERAVGRYAEVLGVAGSAC